MGILEKMSLNGKKAFVTGGARGIGKSIATALAEAGADVALVDVDFAEAEKTAVEIALKTGRELFAVRADVTVPNEVNAMIEKITERFGRLDVAFCNAGICKNIPAEEMSYEDWKQVTDINLTGVFLTAQEIGRAHV